MIKNQIRKIALATAVACASSLTALALPTSYYSSTSTLASGKWVKIKVSESGIHQITYDQLQQWGFSDPSKVAVYGYPASLLSDNKLTTDHPDDLCQVYTFHYQRGDSKKIYFYGEGAINASISTDNTLKVRKNTYSSYGYYFLTDSRQLITPTPLPYTNVTTGTLHRSHLALDYVEDDTFNPTTAGAIYFGSSFLNEPLTMSFPVADYTTATNYSPYFIYRFATSNTRSIKIEAEPQSDIFKFRTSTGEPSSSFGSDNAARYTISTLKPRQLTYNANSKATSFDIKFTSPASAGELDPFTSMDYAALIYPRSNKLGTLAQLTMYFPSTLSVDNLQIEGTNLFTEVWNIKDPTSVTPFARNFNNSTSTTKVTFNAAHNSRNGAGRIIAFNPQSDDFPGVTLVGEVANQNLHGDATPDMVIITNTELKGAAAELAAIHKEHQGLDVIIKTPEEIYNEFSSGTPSAMAIRRYVKMLYDRDPQKMRHLLIFGFGDWDNRSIEERHENRIITYQTEQEEWASHPNRSYCHDGYFGILGEDVEVNFATLDGTSNPVYPANDIIYAPMDINVGRIPVNNASDANIVIEKIRGYFENPPIHGSFNRAVLLCDDGDQNQFVKLCDSIADLGAKVAPPVTFTKTYNALYAWTAQGDAEMLQGAFKSALQKGQGLWVYVGHGRHDMLGHDQNIYALPNIDNNDYEVQPFTILATCDNFNFDRINDDIASHLLYKRGGGAINLVAACRSVYKSYNNDIAIAVGKAYLTAKPGTYAGDLYRAGRNSVVATAGRVNDKYMATNTLCYNFGGDPAIPVFVPSHNVTTSSVNGINAGDGSTKIDVYPMKAFTVTGEITDADGKLDTSFNGTISLDIYDSAYKVQSSLKGESNPSDTKLVNIDETMLSTVGGEVKDGRFSVEVSVPVPVRPDLGNRITYFAANESNTSFASGVFTGLNVRSFDESKVDDLDTDAPVITALYLNDPSFTSGDEVSASPTAYVEIAADKSGINLSDGHIGSGPRFILDGSVSYPVGRLVHNADGSSSAYLNLSELKDGYHTLSFSANDNFGNHTSATIGFMVVNRNSTATLKVDETPARTEATLSIDHTFSTEPTGRLVIEDMAGNTVYSKSGCSFPLTWDLKDNAGGRVADGHYKAYVILNAGLEYGNTAKTEIIVVK